MGGGAPNREGRVMLIGDAFIWFLLGDVAVIYLAAFLLQWVADKVWFRYVDKVLEAAQDSSADRYRRVAFGGAEARRVAAGPPAAA